MTTTDTPVMDRPVDEDFALETHGLSTRLICRGEEDVLKPAMAVPDSPNAMFRRGTSQRAAHSDMLRVTPFGKTGVKQAAFAFRLND
jgi:hypothetical protein